MIPNELLRSGSYATVRTSGGDEDLERVVPLAGQPWRQADVNVRKPLSFGMISGGQCADNKGLRDYLVIVIWYLGGDISSPEQQRERVKIEIRAQQVLGSTVEIPREVAASANPARLVVRPRWQPRESWSDPNQATIGARD